MGVYVRLHICGNIKPLLPMLKAVNADILDLDSMVPVAQARKDCGHSQILTGNIAPVEVLRDKTPVEVFHEIERCWVDAEKNNYMTAAGCEIPRDTSGANIRAMTDFARTHKYISTKK